jgi:protein O-GlcNAc transferase
MLPDPLEETKLRKRLEKLNACLISGQLDEARAGFEQILAEYPRHPQALHGLGVLAVHEGQLDAGERLLREAIAQEADNARFWNDLGEALRLQQRYPEAIAAYRCALEAAPDFTPAANNLGVALAMTGALDEAEAQLLAAIERCQDDPFSWNSLGVVRKQLGRFEEALIAYETAVRLKPDFAEALANHAELIQAHPELLADSVRRLAQFLQGQQDRDVQGSAG